MGLGWERRWGWSISSDATVTDPSKGEDTEARGWPVASCNCCTKNECSCGYCSKKVRPHITFDESLRRLMDFTVMDVTDENAMRPAFLQAQDEDDKAEIETCIDMGVAMAMEMEMEMEIPS